MKKLLFILSLTILTACGGSDSVDEPLIVNPIDEISGEYILDRFVANSNTQSMCRLICLYRKSCIDLN